MKKFKYHMQNILDINKNLEAQAKNEFAIRMKKKQEEEEKLEQLKVRRESYETMAKDARKEGHLNIKELVHIRNALDYMEDAIKKQVLNIHVAEKNVEQARIHLSEIVMDRKTHEKLKEKQLKAYMQEMNAEESKEIDQLVSYTYGIKGTDVS